MIKIFTVEEAVKRHPPSDIGWEQTHWVRLQNFINDNPNEKRVVEINKNGDFNFISIKLWGENKSRRIAKKHQAKLAKMRAEVARIRVIIDKY